MKVKLCPACRYTRGDIAENYDSDARHYLCLDCPARGTVKTAAKFPRDWPRFHKFAPPPPPAN